MSGIRLLACAITPSLRAAHFGGDEDLDEGGRAAALVVSAFGRGQLWVCAPSRAARETAQAIGHSAVPEPALADPDFGRWDGLGLDEVQAEDPKGLAQWLTDAQSAPHGGESLARVRERVGGWLDAMAGETAVVVAHPLTVRAALAHALRVPGESLWSLDVAPLALVRLTHRSARWHVHFS